MVKTKTKLAGESILTHLYSMIFFSNGTTPRLVQIRNLPHFDGIGTFPSITYRLNDSMPKGEVEPSKRWNLWLKANVNWN